jgi:hypothetical protein
MSKKNFCELNLLDREEVEEGRDLADHAQANWIRSAFSQYKSEQLGFNDEYFETAGLIINASATFAEKYSRCGMPKMGNPCWCNLRKYCPRCAGVRGRALIARFRDCFHGRNWYSITLSFTGDLSVAEAAGIAEQLWVAAHDVFTAKMKDWRVDGGIYSEEVSIRQYLPALITPHAHALINGDEVPDGAEKELERALNRVLKRKAFRRLGLKADVLVKSIGSEKHFENMLPYLQKECDLVSQYAAALETKVDGSPGRLVALNSDVKDVVLGLSTIAINRKQLRYFGNMLGSSKNRIGIRLRKHERRRRKRPTIKSPAQRISEERALCA